MKSNIKVAVIQHASVPFDSEKTTTKACSIIEESADNGAELIVFPEAFLGTYPKGLTFDCAIGKRHPEGREDFLKYFNGAVEINGKEINELCTASKENSVFVVMGIIDRDGSTLYCTVVFIDPKKGVVGKRRKLMPTGSERLVWGFGDGSTLDVIDSELGKIGAVICWENYMPSLRAAMYGQGVEIYCAPTADDRDTWVASMQHIAMEGRCFVISACQFLKREDFGDDYRGTLGDNPDDILMRGGSMVVGPLGEIIAGPVYNESTIIYADIDRDTLVRSKLDFDPVGHYARPDVLSVHVDKEEKKAVHY